MTSKTVKKPAKKTLKDLMSRQGSQMASKSGGLEKLYNLNARRSGQPPAPANRKP